MIGNDVMFASPPTKAPAPGATVHKPFIAAPDKPANETVILDMGEASREQGFKMNGCR